MGSWKGKRVGQGNVPKVASRGKPCSGIDTRAVLPAVSSAPFVSVIVPVRNEGRFVERTIKQLLEQDYPANRFEILVVDGRSSDSTRSLVEARAHGCLNLRLAENPRFLSSAARNIGIQQARGSLIVIVDGHCDLQNASYLRDLVDAFERSGADCLGRPQPLEVKGASALQEAIAVARASWLGHHPDSFVYSSQEQFVPAKSVAVAYRRSVFEMVGLFDESFDACEDVELNHRIDRAGLRCFFTPKIAIRYYPRSSIRALFYQMARYGRGRVRLLRKHPETFSAGGFLPAVWLAGVALGPLAGLAWAPLWWIVCGALALYLAVVGTTSARLVLLKRKARLIGWLPLVFLTVHAGSGYGVLSELLRARSPKRAPSVVLESAPSTG
jgi:succinoglycan biosynthesis protein ExoA